MRNLLLGGVCLLAACTLTGNISADSAAFATEAAAFNQNANANIAGIASGVLTVVKASGQSACGAASELHGVFSSVVPAAIALGAVDPEVGVTEAGAFAAIQIGCKIIDAANATTPVATVAAAAASVVTQLPAIKAALTTGAPAVAAIALAAAPMVAAAP